ncbi:MAG TPA: DMT family transporter [Gemmatimonadales bacterium]|jgi:drug/metabolite transporter (DMT)-like permease|nr:DMT family transporter [Gemmatimonadales bacterium]
MTGPPSRRTAALLMLLVVVIWGLNVTVTKWTLSEFTPLAFTAIRFALASALLMLVLYRRQGSLRLPPGTFWPVVGLGLIGNSIYQLGFIFGLAHTTATNSGLVLASMPVMVAGLGAVFRIERLTRHSAEGLVLATIGVVLVVASHGLGFSGTTMLGDLLTFGATICWAIFTLGVRRQSLPLSSLAITAWTVLTGSVPLVLLGIPALAHMDWTRTTAAGWGGVLYSSAFSLVLSYIIWNRSIKVVGSNRTAIFACLTPVFAMLTAMLILGERPGLAQFSGGALVIAGVLLSQRSASLPGTGLPTATFSVRESDA